MRGQATRHLAADHRAAEGHFPGNPIIPGAVLLRVIVCAIAGDHAGAVCRRVPAAKFLYPVRPGDTLLIEWDDRGDGDVRFTCRIGEAGPRAVTGALRFAPV